MAAVVVVTSTPQLSCGHSGKRTLSSSAKLTVSGRAVTLYSSAAVPGAWSNCTFTLPSGTAQPCKTTTAVSQGRSTKVTAGSQAVLLGDLVATTENPPPNAVTVTAGQSTLTAS